MKNINFKALSITVLVAALGSNVAFANDDISKALPKIEKSMPSFSQLITKHDLDNSKTLSPIELSTNSQLLKMFKKMDFNNDKQIAKKEYNIFVKSMKQPLS